MIDKCLSDSVFDSPTPRIFTKTALVENRIVMLHVFAKKSQKTPKKELETARKRLKEVTQ